MAVAAGRGDPAAEACPVLHVRALIGAGIIAAGVVETDLVPDLYGTGAFGPALVGGGDHVRVHRIRAFGGGRCCHENAPFRFLTSVSFKKDIIPPVRPEKDIGVNRQAIGVEQEPGRCECPEVFGEGVVNARIGVPVKERQRFRELTGHR